MFGKYRKSVTAVVTGCIGFAATVIDAHADGPVGPEWVTGATVLAIALGVYAIPNAGVGSSD